MEHSCMLCGALLCALWSTLVCFWGHSWVFRGTLLGALGFVVLLCSDLYHQGNWSIGSQSLLSGPVLSST